MAASRTHAPDAKLFLLGDWQAAHPDQTSELRIVGNRWSERAHDLKMFLTRNHVP